MKLNGREIAEKIYQNLRARVAILEKKKIIPHLVVFLVGENPASIAYVTLKQKKGEEIGCKVTILRFEETITTEELEKKIKLLNDDPFVHGILIQRPLPAHIDVTKLEMTTNPEKDIDGFHPDSPYTLPLPLAVAKILEEIFYIENAGVTSGEGLPSSARNEVRTSDGRGARQAPVGFKQWLQSKNILILGKGPTGGGPIITYLQKLNVTATVIDSKTHQPEKLLKKGDIVIAAVGRENIINAKDLKKGVILIGVGILRGKNGKLRGDYDEETIQNIASFYTSTPGGVGPVNVACLIKNLITATEKQTRSH